MRQQQRLPILAAIASVLATLVVVAVPTIDFAYRRPSLHVALETAAMLIALLAAYLVYGRFHRSRAVSDLLLLCALAAMAAANFIAALSTVADTSLRFATWAPVGCRVVGSVLFAAAAFSPATLVRRARTRSLWALATLGAVLTGIAVIVALAGTRLPVGVETELAGDPGRPDLHGHAVVLAVQLVSMALFAAAAVGFSIRSSRTGDDFMRWMAVGAVFAVFARLNYFLYPSLYSDWVYTGDVFRLLFYASLVVGAAREIRGYWEGVVHSAVLEERRRIARDLHDGAAQELAFVLRRLRGLRGVNEAMLAPVVAAAERGLDDSRRAIAALSRPLDEPLDKALADALGQVAARSGIGLALDLAEDLRVPTDIREGLIRIACEAVNNAANHSGASLVSVELANGKSLRLCVEDAGAGFDPARVVPWPRGGFGLTDMRDRAGEIGATFTIVTSPGAGTRIEVDVT